MRLLCRSLILCGLGAVMALNPAALRAQAYQSLSQEHSDDAAAPSGQGSSRGLVQAPAPAADPAMKLRRGFPKTDVSRHAVALSDLVASGQTRDAVPAIDRPRFVGRRAVAEIDPREPVAVLTLDGELRAYPLRYLVWHELVNDRIGDRPILISWCPMSNALRAFYREVDGTELTFGQSGLIHGAGRVIYDRETESLWQQYTGASVVGAHMGRQLTPVPVSLRSLGSLLAEHPDARILAQPAHVRRAYGLTPYAGSDGRQWPAGYRGMYKDPATPAMSYVVAVGKEAWPLSRLQQEGQISQSGYRFTWHSGMASLLDTKWLAEGRDLGEVEVVDLASGRPVDAVLTFAFAFRHFTPGGVIHAQ